MPIAPNTDDINSAIEAVQDYIETLKIALAAAANKGNRGLAARIESRFSMPTRWRQVLPACLQSIR